MQSEGHSPVYGVILAGGFGERLWPVSTKKYPKYCLCIGDSRKSLLQQAYERLNSIAPKDKILVVTQNSQLGIIRKQLPGLLKRNIIAEPFRKNTAAAIGLAAIIIRKAQPDAVMVVVPADQFIPDKAAFSRLMKSAVSSIRMNNSLLTIGIKPTYPATGYGYIKRVTSHQSPVTSKKYKAYKVASFVEKPDIQRAKRFVKSGYLWNSGMFVWRADAILAGIRSHMPGLFNRLLQIGPVFNSRKLAGIYKTLDNISIDYGVLEKSKDVFVMSADIKWDDVGSWISMMKALGADKNGNEIDANFKGMETEDCVVISKNKKHLIASFGLKGVIVVQSPNATLLCSNKHAERLKEMVNYINSDNKTKRFC